jgi:hypothetical protein
VILEETTQGLFFTPAISFDPDSNVFTANFSELPEGFYRLTLVSGDSAFEDVLGNDMDGEPLGAALDATPTGDGVPGGNYVIEFSVDPLLAQTVRPFERLEPPGSLMFASRDNSALLNEPGDMDDFEFFAQANETVAAVAVPADPSVTLSLEIVGGAGPFAAPAPGAPVVLPATAIPGTGNVVLRVAGDGFARYSLDIFRNAVLEASVGDTSDAVPLSLDDAFPPRVRAQRSRRRK